MTNKLKLAPLVIALGALIVCFQASSQDETKKPSSMPAAKMLDKIIEAERSDPGDPINRLKNLKVFWNPMVMPRSIRSWMMEELTQDTWHKIRTSDKL